LLTSIDRAMIVVVPESGRRVAGTDKLATIIANVGEDPWRAVVSINWVTECIAQQRLVELSEYRISTDLNEQLLIGENQIPPPSSLPAHHETVAHIVQRPLEHSGITLVPVRWPPLDRTDREILPSPTTHRDHGPRHMRRTSSTSRTNRQTRTTIIAWNTMSLFPHYPLGRDCP
jgi:hypothetical protein